MREAVRKRASTLPVWKYRVGGAVAVGVAIAIGLALIPAATARKRYSTILDPAFLTSRHRRLIHFFGDCEPAGYGYLKRVLNAYSRLESDPRRRPMIRYHDYNRRTEYLFEPTRFEADPSIVVAIGLSESDTHERELRHASRDTNGNWRFAVVTNFDLLTGIEVELEPESRGDVRLRLYRKENDEKPVWLSTGKPGGIESTDATGSVRWRFRILPPLQLFRSNLIDPLVVRAEGGAGIRRMTANGIVTNIEGYRVVHQDRTGACFTAVRQGDEERWASLIRELESSND